MKQTLIIILNEFIFHPSILMNNYCTRQPNSKLQEYEQPVTRSETDETLTIFGDVWFTTPANLQLKSLEIIEAYSEEKYICSCF